MLQSTFYTTLYQTRQPEQRGIAGPLPVASTMPSKMTTISKSSFSSWPWDMSQKAEGGSISWEMTNGETRKRRSSPVSKPTLMSVWSSGMNSPGGRTERNRVWERDRRRGCNAATKHNQGAVNAVEEPSLAKHPPPPPPHWRGRISAPWTATVPTRRSSH